MRKKKSEAMVGERNYVKMFVALAFVLVLAVFAISATRAKYQTVENGTDSARVAKFDVSAGELEKNFNLFGTIYDSDGSLEDDVWSNEGDNVAVIAPGTQGEFEFQYTNNSEVSVAYETELDVIKSDERMPIEFATVKEDIPGTEENVYCKNLAHRGKYKPGLCIGGRCETITVGGTLADWTDDIAALDLSGSIEKENGEDSKTIYWRWAYEGDSENADAIDTELGEAGTAVVDVAAKVTFTQID